MSLRAAPAPSSDDRTPEDIGCDPKVVEAIVALERGGRLTPEKVVDEARSPDSPLHDSFTWDDRVAAEAYRIEQARSLIRRVRIIVHVGETVTIYPRYVRDPAKASDERGYVTQHQLRTEPEHAMAAVRAEFARAAGCLDRAQTIARVQGHDFGLARRIGQLMKSLRDVAGDSGDVDGD